MPQPGRLTPSPRSSPSPPLSPSDPPLHSVQDVGFLPKPFQKRSHKRNSGTGYPPIQVSGTTHQLSGSSVTSALSNGAASADFYASSQQDRQVRTLDSQRKPEAVASNTRLSTPQSTHHELASDEKARAVKLDTQAVRRRRRTTINPEERRRRRSFNVPLSDSNLVNAGLRPRSPLPAEHTDPRHSQSQALDRSALDRFQSYSSTAAASASSPEGSGSETETDGSSEAAAGSQGPPSMPNGLTAELETLLDLTDGAAPDRELLTGVGSSVMKRGASLDIAGSALSLDDDISTFPESQFRLRGRAISVPKPIQTDAGGPRRGSGIFSRNFDNPGTHGPSPSPLPTQRKSSSRAEKPMLLPRQVDLLQSTPLAISFILTRKTCEKALVIAAHILSISKLFQVGEIQVSIELLIIAVLTVVYLFHRRVASTKNASGNSEPSRKSSSPVMSHSKLSKSRHAQSQSANFLARLAKLQTRSTSLGQVSEGTGTFGWIWATDDRDYRDCVDDGVIFALLLGPLLAASMFYSTLQDLARRPHQPLGEDWQIEAPVIFSTTPSVRPWLPGTAPPNNPTETALTALALSRRHLAHLTCLLSLILQGHLVWSQRRESRRSTATPMPASKAPKQMWSRMSEWRRTGSIVSSALVATIFFVTLKAAAMAMGLTQHYDLSFSDIVIATLFFQFSLYVCVRLARRGFTLGELGLVCHSATGLFMETVNLTRSQVRILRTPFVKTFRLANPLLVFQLALLPGSLLTGFLLSPVLVLSRRIAQNPVHRLRLPTEKTKYRKGLAATFYAGAAIVCGGVIGTWARWCLGWRDPWVWVIVWIAEGKTWWLRPALLCYWALLASIFVAGWTRQLSRARKRRSWVTHSTVKGNQVLSVHSSTVATSSSHNRSPSPADIQRGMASQMMDGMDQRLPTLSVNARRKSFHALAVVMFVPGILLDPAFTNLSFSLAFALFTFAEYIRYFAVYPFGAAVHLFLNEFLDGKDSGTAILSHFYLLTGCATGVWLEGSRDVLNVFGVIALGIGDALVSLFH